MTTDGTSARAQRDLRAFREVTAMALAALGIEVTPRTQYRRDGDQVSDLIGPVMDRWLIRTRLRIGDKLSNTLDDANARAKAAGRPYAAVIHRRNGRDPRQTFVSMTLETFAGMLKAHEQEVETEAAKVRLQAMTPPQRLP